MAMSKECFDAAEAHEICMCAGVTAPESLLVLSDLAAFFLIGR